MYVYWRRKGPIDLCTYIYCMTCCENNYKNETYGNLSTNSLIRTISSSNVDAQTSRISMSSCMGRGDRIMLLYMVMVIRNEKVIFKRVQHSVLHSLWIYIALVMVFDFHCFAGVGVWEMEWREWVSWVCTPETLRCNKSEENLESTLKIEPVIVIYGNAENIRTFQNMSQRSSEIRRLQPKLKLNDPQLGYRMYMLRKTPTGKIQIKRLWIKSDVIRHFPSSIIKRFD